MKPETKAIHTPNARRDGAIAPPIHLTTTFEHGPASEDICGHFYVRESNPNVQDLETRLAALDLGGAAVAFGSGMAAAAALLHTVPADTEVLFHKDIYFDIRYLAGAILPQKNIQFKDADFTDLDAVRAAVSDQTSLLWYESPTNPHMDVIDIEAISEIAKSVNAKSIIDGTFATPALQQPIALGADYVLHSMTKYMGGHSDIQGGALVLKDNDEIAEQLFKHRKLNGAVLSPFNAWLISRGLQTLHCRMEKHCQNAFAIAKALAEHPNVERVRYPLLAEGAQLDIAKRQLTKGGGMVSFDVAGGEQDAIGAASRLKLFVNATSLGGVESLVEHRASIEGPDSTTPKNLIRLSVGLEHQDDLIADLMQALDG